MTCSSSHNALTVVTTNNQYEEMCGLLTLDYQTA